MSHVPMPMPMPMPPTTRSRTLLFLSYRDSTTRSSRPQKYSYSYSYSYSDNDSISHDDEHARLISRDNNSAQHLAIHLHLPPKWVDISDQVHEILVGTQSKISVLERLHAKHVLPGFADRSAEEREIEAVTTDITRDFRRCQSLIQSIPSQSAGGPQTHRFPPQQLTQHERLAAQNVQRGLAAKVQELSSTFRKKQRIYLETLQGHAIKNQDLLVASGAVTLKGSEGMSDLDEDMRVAASNQSNTLLSQQQLQQEEEVDVDLLARDREITEIARSIGMLAELFKDLSSLVIDQGTLLDSVEYNIEQTSAQMTEAVTELRIAEGYQKNTGRRKCIILLLLIIFGLVVVLIFKPRRHAPPASVPISTSKTAESEEGQLAPIPIDVTTIDSALLGEAIADELHGSTKMRKRGVYHGWDVLRAPLRPVSVSAGVRRRLGPYAYAGG